MIGVRVSSPFMNTSLQPCQANEHWLEGMTWSHQLQWAITLAFLHSTSLMQHDLCKGQALPRCFLSLQVDHSLALTCHAFEVCHWNGGVSCCMLVQGACQISVGCLLLRDVMPLRQAFLGVRPGMLLASCSGPAPQCLWPAMAALSVDRASSCQRLDTSLVSLLRFLHSRTTVAQLRWSPAKVCVSKLLYGLPVLLHPDTDWRVQAERHAVVKLGCCQAWKFLAASGRCMPAEGLNMHSRLQQALLCMAWQ